MGPLLLLKNVADDHESAYHRCLKMLPTATNGAGVSTEKHYRCLGRTHYFCWKVLQMAMGRYETVSSISCEKQLAHLWRSTVFFGSAYGPT